MNNLKNKFSVSVVILIFFVTSSSVFAFSTAAPDERTGAPNESTCATVGCHAGNVLNASDGSLMLTVPKYYSPGEVYDIVVNLSRPGQKRWGFEMTALNSNNTRAGTFDTVDENTQLSEKNSKQYIKHTSSGTAHGTEDRYQWTFKWTAPNTDVGSITFYAAGNAANGNWGTTGDYIYTQTAASIFPVYGVTLDGEGDLTTKTADASGGVSYILKITNTGNIEDTFDLTTTDTINATLGRTAITLASGASQNVPLTIAGAALATAGDYQVKVTATSQGDNRETAEITTTTTILPIYGVTLASVGALSTETADASEGVTYTLNVTNTGNAEDTIDLSTSGDAVATLGRTAITLASDASAEVTLTVSDDSLQKAGDYAVKVTAISQGDNRETAEITTTTTILPVYGVMVEGVNNLITKTVEPGEDVSYTLTITNTGNIEDTIDLVTSDDATTLSTTSVTLASGFSAEITLNISGDTLKTDGDYEVKVTATSQGDNAVTSEIITTTTVSIVPVYGVMLSGVDDIITKTTDPGKDVSYTLAVANTGNMEDTIDLATFDDAATLSNASVALASGASAEITLTVSGDALATEGDYAVKVTATSQGDSTITTEITITTTVVFVYGVMLQGELTGATMDILAGISYRLTVTNDGNTEDTIVLGSSAEAGIEGSVLGAFTASSDQEIPASQLEIVLDPGATAQVAFIASGDFFTKPGKYEIKVTATSQGDSTKSAEISTVTTIEPVPWDLNADGTVNILDLVQVANQFGESGENLTGDVNIDGNVNILDLVQVASYFGRTQVEIVQENQ